MIIQIYNITIKNFVTTFVDQNEYEEYIRDTPEGIEVKFKPTTPIMHINETIHDLAESDYAVFIEV